MSVVDESLNYEKMVHTYGTYQLSKVMPQAGGAPLPVSGGGGNESIFEIPPKVINFSKSILSFTITPTTIATAASYLFANMDGYACIRQLQVYTRSGLYLCDINDFDNYTNMTMRRNTLSNDVLGWDNPAAEKLVTTTVGSFSGLVPGVFQGTALMYRPTGAAITNVLENLYVLPGVISGGTNYSPSINFRIPLGDIPECFVSENKDVFFGGEILYMRIVWNASQQIYFQSTDADVPTVATPADGDYGGGATITQLTLLTAIETNPVIENLIKSKVSSIEGLQMLMPMVYYNKISLGQATNHNITTRYNRAHGIKLKKIYWSAYNQTEFANTAFDKSNLSAAPKVTQYSTMINNIRTSQYDYVTANLDDYIVKKNSLRGSAIYSSNEYYFNWVWVEDFTDNNPLLKQYYELKDNYIEGLDLENEIKYDVNATTPGAVGYNHYVYAVTEKLLTISSAGINFT